MQIFPKGTKINFIALLEFSIFFTVFLNGIIGQMDKIVVSGATIKFEATCSNITVSIPISLN